MIAFLQLHGRPKMITPRNVQALMFLLKILKINLCLEERERKPKFKASSSYFHFVKHLILNWYDKLVSYSNVRSKDVHYLTANKTKLKWLPYYEPML